MPQDNESDDTDTSDGEVGDGVRPSSSRIFTSPSTYNSSDGYGKSRLQSSVTNHQEPSGDNANGGVSDAQQQNHLNGADILAEDVGDQSMDSLGTQSDLPGYVQRHRNDLTFPEKLMLALTHIEKECARLAKKAESECFGWVLDGTAFIVRDKEKLCRLWLPQFFGQQKFDSFTRKLYRWEFRKLGLTKDLGPDYRREHVCFINPNFQRDNKHLLKNMKSVTAIKTRSELVSSLGLLPDDISRVAAARKEYLPDESRSSDLEQKLLASVGRLAHSTLNPQANVSTTLYASLPGQQGRNPCDNIDLFQRTHGVPVVPATRQTMPQEYPMAQNQIQQLLLAMVAQGQGRMGNNMQPPWYQNIPQQTQSHELPLHLSTMVPNQMQLLLQALSGQVQGAAFGEETQQLPNQSNFRAQALQNSECVQSPHLPHLQSLIQSLLHPSPQRQTSHTYSSQHQPTPSITNSSAFPLPIPPPFRSSGDSLATLQQIAQWHQLATQPQQAADQFLSQQRRGSLRAGDASLTNESNVQPIFALLQRLSTMNQQQQPPSSDRSHGHQL